MESNRDEALKCLSISQRHLNSDNLSSARRFCEKSINLYPTPEASKLLERISELEKSSSGSSSFSSGTEAHQSASSTKHRHTSSSSNTNTGSPSSSSSSKPNGTASGSGGEKREYTPDQAKVVKRILSCKVTEYYEILSLSRECEEAEIKKAYRKVRLIFNATIYSTMFSLT